MKRQLTLLSCCLVALFLGNAAANASTPRSGDGVLGLEQIDRLSAPSPSAALDVDSLEPRDDAQRFALGEVSLLGAPRTERFRFTGDELRPQPLTVFEPSYPETRVWAFDFLGTPLVGASSGVSHELQRGCGDSWLGTAEGIGHWLSEDPAGDVDSPNRYAYVGWRPNEATDPTGEFAFVPVLLAGFGTGLTAKYFIDSTAEEIDRSSTLDPHASIFWGGARGFGRAGAVTLVTGGIAGGIGGGLARSGLGLAGRYAIGGLVAGPAGVLTSDVIDVDVLGAREAYSSPLVYAGAALLGGGTGLLGGWAGARYVDEAAGIAASGWNASRTQHSGLGLSNDRSFLSFSRGWGAANGSAAEYQTWLTAANLRGGLRSAGRGVASAMRGVRRALSVEDHHLIPESLWNANANLAHAEALGISRNSLWNVRATFGHRGGHAAAYYSDVNSMVNGAFSGQSMSALSAAQIESTLAATARGVQLGIRWGRIPGIARLFGQRTLRLY